MIKNGVNLAEYSTFNTGGQARYFVEVKSLEGLKKAINFARKEDKKIFILGGGSNVLLPDRGIDGLVIKMGIKGLSFSGNLISAGAGESWDKIVAESVKRGLGGIENLSLIPGTVGGAVYQNIGAYGAELKDVLESVEVFDLRSDRTKNLPSSQCRFRYRDTLFQHPEGKNYIVTGVQLKLSKKFIPKLDYIELRDYFYRDKVLTPDTVRRAVVKIRKSQLVYPTPKIGTAGSFFKNPTITPAAYRKILTRHPDIIGRKTDGGLIKLFAGQLVELAGWKGKRFGNVGTSAKHSMVLVSYNGAKSRDLLNLAKKVRNSVKAKFGAELEPGIKIISS